MKHLQDVHMSYASHLAHAWRLSLILLVHGLLPWIWTHQGLTKSAIPDAVVSLFNRRLDHRFGLRRWTMVVLAKLKVQWPTWLEGWHRCRHRLCPVDRHRAVSGNPNDSLAGLVAVGSAVKRVACIRDREDDLNRISANDIRRHTTR